LKILGVTMPSYEREARAGNTGATENERDQLCFDLRQRGWSLRKIGQHPKVQMSHVSVMYAIDRVVGKPRARQSPNRCSDCGEAWDADELDGGVCPFCA
jgi:predicted  nucleic acid-binding Zn ribbon protein